MHQYDNQRSGSGWLTLLLSLATAAFGLMALLASLLIWLRFNIEVPVRDMARLLPLLETAVNEGLSATRVSDWFSLHSFVHRVAVVRAFAYLDYAFLSGRNWVLYAGTAASILITLYVYSRAAYTSLREQRGAQFFIPGLVLLFLCSPMLYWNLVIPLCATWYYNLAFSAVGTWMLVERGHELRARHAVCIMLLGAGAAFSNFSGVIFCLFLPIVAFLLRSPYWIHLTVAAVVFTGLYTLGIESTSDKFAASEEFHEALVKVAEDNAALFREFGWFHQTLYTVKTTIHNVAMHLGVPVSGASPVVAAVAVAASIVLLCYFWLQLLVSRFKSSGSSSYSPATVFFLSMATLQLGISCSIWLGRIGLSDPASARYQSITIVYWLSFIFLLLCESQSRAKSRVPLLLWLALAGAIMLNVLTTIRPVGVLAFNYNQYQQEKILRQLGATQPAALINAKQASWRDTLSQYKEFTSRYTLPPVTQETSSPGHYRDKRCRLRNGAVARQRHQGSGHQKSDAQVGFANASALSQCVHHR